MRKKSKKINETRIMYFNFLENEFDFYYNKDMKNPLKEGLRRILERMENISKILEAVLQPENNYSAIHEYSFLNEKEKKEIVLIYRKFMYYQRAIIEALLKNNVEDIKKILEKITCEWESMKNQTIIIIKKIKESWNSSSDIGSMDEYKKYFG
ncbi:MAG: hypothetical protein QXG00_00820 [Candidatus Woesearchaeota archaeon]